MNIPIQATPEQANLIIEAFAERYGYTETIDDGSGGQKPNPENKTQFFVDRIRVYIEDVYGGHVDAISEKARKEIADIEKARVKNLPKGAAHEPMPKTTISERMTRAVKTAFKKKG